MEKITSFTINHLKLLPGVYVSRVDYVAGNPVTTFDLRMTAPNREPVMNTAEMHTIEHLGATFLRNDPEFGEKDIYFGPMGCRTGFYLVLAGEYKSRDIVPLMRRMFTFIAEFEGDIPGAAARDCGNYLDQNLGMAKYLAKKYLAEVLNDITDERVESITLIGVCTDICVISNAMILKAFFPDKPIIVDAACCAGSTPEGHKNALAVMKTCQIQIENEE